MKDQCVVEETPDVNVTDTSVSSEEVKPINSPDDDQPTSKEYWKFVWTLFKYFFEYLWIAIKETFRNAGLGFMKWAQKNHLVNAIDENGNVIKDEEDDDEDDDFIDECPEQIDKCKFAQFSNEDDILDGIADQMFEEQ